MKAYIISAKKKNLNFHSTHMNKVNIFLYERLNKYNNIKSVNNSFQSLLWMQILFYDK